MLKIYLDYYAGDIFTFPLGEGPEPEGTTAVDQEVLASRSAQRGLYRHALVWSGKWP